MASKKLQELAEAKADRWAMGATVVIGAALGALLTLIGAPRMQRRFRHFEVDPSDPHPAIVMIALGTLLGAFLGWRVAKRLRRRPL